LSGKLDVESIWAKELRLPDSRKTSKRCFIKGLVVDKIKKIRKKPEILFSPSE
jgi:hypothetical protein